MRWNFFGLRIWTVCLLLLSGCGKNESPQMKLFRENQGKQLDLNGLRNAKTLIADSTILFRQVLKSHRYLSLVYLDETCDFCRFKLYEWNRHADELAQIPEVAYVILFHGQDFRTFQRISLHRDSLWNGFFIVMDTEKHFVIDNASIPYELLDNTILIDSSSTMLLFGDPFATPAMSELYRKICVQ